MCSKQKIRKIAWCLLLVALISLIPTNTFSVLADSDIVPPFPYDELQTIGENNYVLFKVHGVDQVDYIECIIPSKGLHGAFDSVLPGLSYSSLGGWVLQINSIDYYFKNGQSVYFDLQSLFTTSFMPVNNDDDFFPAWLEFVYCTCDVWGWDDDKISGYNLRFFKDQNFIIEPAATPTPSPSPDAPSFEFDINNSDYAVLFRVVVPYNGLNVGDLVAKKLSDFPSGTVCIYPDYSYNSGSNYINIFNSFIFFDPSDRMTSSSSNFYKLDNDLNYISTIYGNSYGSLFGSRSYGGGYLMYGQSNGYYTLPNSINNLSYELEVVGINNNIINIVPPSPTPTTAPTPIPQPSTTPEPEDPDKNSSWGWGIVNTLKYIFIPDKNKLIRLEKTTQTRFQQFGGGYDDLKHVSGFEDPVRPQNVIMNWKPFGSDSPEQQQQITLVDFEQIDFYLFQTSSGMFICDCLKASFTFLMFGYLIHVIRKHFVIENTSNDESDGGGD